MTPFRDCDRDRGLTLIELIVASAIAAVITLSIGSALVVGLRLTNNTYTRIDQSNAEMTISRILAPDIYAAEGAIVLNGTSAAACGNVANPLLVLTSRTDPASDLVAGNSTTVVWSLNSTQLVRTVCRNNNAATERVVVVDGISAFVPQACAAPCAVVKVDVTAASGPGVPTRSFSVTVQRRGSTA